jgi:hypothetical protein
MDANQERSFCSAVVGGLKLRFYLPSKGYKQQVNLIICDNSIHFMVYEVHGNDFRNFTNSDIPNVECLTKLAIDAVESHSQHEANFLNSQAYRDLRDYVCKLHMRGIIY